MRKGLMLGAILAIVASTLAAAHAAWRPESNDVAATLNPAQGRQVVDSVAVRIEDDIITESQVRELEQFQKLVDGQAKPRNEVIQELVDQWIAHGEAQTNQYPAPSSADVDHAFAQLASQFSSRQEFERRYTQEGLSALAVRRLLEEQLYLARFLDYRFRPAAQVNDAQVEAYYRDEFTPQVKARNEQLPPLDSVEDTIREVLIQKAINDRATQWLDDTRERLKIEIVPGHDEARP
jgi:hypothetical protein